MSASDRVYEPSLGVVTPDDDKGHVIRKRAPKALVTQHLSMPTFRSADFQLTVTVSCQRCRDQKIKCDGLDPCQQCTKRNLECHNLKRPRKVVTTQRYIDGLKEKIELLQRTIAHQSPVHQESTQGPSPRQDLAALDNVPAGFHQSPEELAQSRSFATEPKLTNPLAFHTTDWVTVPNGLPTFMGTSSNWSFGRRVLRMAYERYVGKQLPPDGLMFDGEIYDMRWNGQRESSFVPPTLPSQDFALYLINSVQFHCGQLYYLYAEESFMKQFTNFHRRPETAEKPSTLWMVHYLLILAFGKAFVDQSGKLQRPPGMEHFTHAMQIMPDLSFCDGDPIERVQILCCTALYLQCIEKRIDAHRKIGEALRMALAYGMHTEMHSKLLESDYVQRCRRLWWTVYVLERQMSSLMGVPMGIAEECISTPLPAFPDQPERENSLRIQVQLSRVLQQIDYSVYGIEGKLGSRYVGATQSVLRSIANVSDQMNGSLKMHGNEATGGISRLAAHLHLLRYQCIILTTRPLLYIFLQSRLGHEELALAHSAQSESIRGLIQICVESAQQVVKILTSLLDQGLLEAFLPFDLNAAYTSMMTLLMAPAIDSSLLPERVVWTQRAYNIFEELSIRGNKISFLMLREIRQLEDLLSNEQGRDNAPHFFTPGTAFSPAQEPPSHCTNADLYTVYPSVSDEDSALESMLQYEPNAEQLMHLANSMDMDSFTWLWSTTGDEDAERM